jgi:hypothetical protein
MIQCRRRTRMAVWVNICSIEQCPPARASESSPCIFSLHPFLHPVSSSTLHPFCSLRSSFSEFHSPAGSDADVDTNVERRIRHISSYNLHCATMILVPGGPTRAHPPLRALSSGFCPSHPFLYFLIYLILQSHSVKLYCPQPSHPNLASHGPPSPNRTLTHTPTPTGKYGT